jgi:hypothetical protein
MRPQPLHSLWLNLKCCTPPPQVEDHLAEGLRFYMSLQDAVKQHQQQCSDYAYTRALQRDDLQQVGLREGSRGSMEG